MKIIYNKNVYTAVEDILLLHKRQLKFKLNTAREICGTARNFFESRLKRNSISMIIAKIAVFIARYTLTIYFEFCL